MPYKLSVALKRIGSAAALCFLAYAFFFASEAPGAPLPYFGQEEGKILAGRVQKGTFESLNLLQLGGETILDGDGRYQRLFLFSWERDFFLDIPSESFLNVILNSGEFRLTWEYPEVVNPYVVLIGEHSFFYQSAGPGDPFQITRFTGVGIGTGIMKRMEEMNFRLGVEWIPGRLAGGGQRDDGQRLTEFAQFEIDRIVKSKYDESVGGIRLFVSLSSQSLEGFSPELQERDHLLQAMAEKYFPLSQETILGLVARGGQESRSGRYWKTTFGSFQEDGFNLPLPGYFYQQLAAKSYLNGEVHLRSWITPALLGHLGYYAAGGWDSHLYNSSSIGVTYLILGKLPLFAEGGFGHSPAGGAEFLLGTALQW